MNVEIGAKAVLFPDKEYINGFAVAVWSETKGWEKSIKLRYPLIHPSFIHTVHYI